MAVPAIALYASPPSTVSSPYQTTGPHDVDFNSRSASSSSTSSSPASQKPFLGGLSCLFSAKHAASATTTTASSPGGGEELAGCRRHERGGEVELGSSFSYLHYSPFSSSLKREQSPVSVFHGPVSCGSSSGTGFCKSPPLRILGERNGDGSKRLFDGFVRKALSSCIDYGAQSFEVHGRSSVLDEELPFNMEDDDFDETEPCANELLISAQKRHKIFYDDFVVKAFHEAEKAHRGQMRASGDPYLQHCVETAVLLALVGANSTVVAAGLLHDTLDDSFLTYDYIFKTFGAGVADLVEGVSKLSELSKLARDNDTASKSAEADRLHTMFLAMADARAVLIKLADRLHNMMTLDSLPLPKQQRFAKETLEIFAPLANRLGIFSWKEKLENLCFKHINPEQHKDLSSKLVQSFDGTMIASNIQKLEHALKGAGISYHVLSGRPKSVYSIYCKMLKKNLNMSEIHDIHGLRLILENEEDCYEALEIVRCIWSEVPGKFKDYIRRPKFNGYQSLHTVMIGEGGVPIEVQIRTKEMHQQAEIGFAAHWRYKEGGCRYSSFVLQMVEWARWIITWQCEATGNDKSCIGSCRSDMPLCSFPFHSEDCPHSYKPHCDQDGPVFIVVMENDKMSVQEFPSNSTMADLLESVGRGSSRWGSYGFPMKEDLKPRLNSEPVTDPTCLLKMGDIVELTPAISDKSLTEYREEIQRMYDQDHSISSSWPAPRMVGLGGRS